MDSQKELSMAGMSPSGHVAKTTRRHFWQWKTLPALCDIQVNIKY